MIWHSAVHALPECRFAHTRGMACLRSTSVRGGTAVGLNEAHQTLCPFALLGIMMQSNEQR